MYIKTSTVSIFKLVIVSNFLFEKFSIQVSNNCIMHLHTCNILLINEDCQIGTFGSTQTQTRPGLRRVSDPKFSIWLVRI